MAVKTKEVTSSAAITSSGVPCKVLSVSGLGGAGAGTVILKDGGTGGTAKLTLDVGNGATFHHPIKGGGLPFPTDCFATLGGATAPVGVTVEYEDYT